MFCWYVRNTYLENNLREPGRTIQCGVPVDLSEIDVPAFIYSSREDHIVLWRAAYASIGLLAGDTTFVLGASGHIAGVINPPAKNKRNYWVGGSPGGDADQWLATAREVSREAGGRPGATGSRRTAATRSLRRARRATSSIGASSRRRAGM